MKNENYQVMQAPGAHPVKMWTEGVPVEESARLQLANTARMPFIYKHIAVMPDVHLGYTSIPISKQNFDVLRAPLIQAFLL